MSGDDKYDDASSAAFEALFAAAEEVVDRIADKRKGDPGEDSDVPVEESVDADGQTTDAEPAPRVPTPSRAPRPNPISAPTPTAKKSSADGALTLSLIKARDELGELLAHEKKQVAQLQAENQRLTQRVEKLKAGRDTVRERGQRERSAAIDAAQDKLLKEFLPVLDNLERALQVELGEIPDDVRARVDGLRNGVDGVVQLFKASLQKFGVTGFDSVGQPFDPNRHEAIRRVEDTSVPNNAVLEEYHRGYTQGERLLRAALVVVATGGPKSED